MKKVVILTGAGATIPWGGPTTQEITQSLIKDKDYVTISGKPLGAYLYDLLCAFYYRDPESVNFETLINLIEALYDFYHSKVSTGYTEFKSELPVIFEVKHDIEEQILDFKSIYKYENGFFYSKSTKEPFLAGAYENQSFFKNVYYRFINLVVAEVARYCLKNEVEQVRTLNHFYRDFFLFFMDYVIRYYTVNYDRIALIATESNFFDGYDIPEKDYFKFNLEKTILQDDINCHYNLHGSVHFKYIPFEWVSIPNQVCYSEVGTSDDSDQSGRALIKTNVLTGLNKSARILSTPQSEFYQKFYYDCLKADLIITIGYSYSDIHLNQAIQNTLNFNNCKLITIGLINEWVKSIRDPYNNMWQQLQRKMPNPKNDTFSNHTAIDESGWIKSPGGRMPFYWKGFESFLRDQEWQKIK